MTLAQTLSSYVNLNLLIVVGFIGLWLFSKLLHLLDHQIKSITQLKMNYLLILLLVGLTTFQPLLPTQDIYVPTMKIWSAQSIKTFSIDYARDDKSGFLSLPTASGFASVESKNIVVTLFSIFLLLSVVGGFTIVRDLRGLLKIRRNSLRIKQISTVRIYINEEILVPFSYWLPHQANVVIPSHLVSRRQDYKMAIAHELQHHRNGDTKWVYILWGLRLFCVFNPFIHLWSRWISEIQEFACDETLVDHNKVESQAYARCLVEVAQTALHQKYNPVCATGLTFLVDRNILKRRIEKMFTQKKSQPRKSMTIIFGIVIAAFMTITAYASKNVVQDRRVSMEQALVMAKNAQEKSNFPIVINDLVLKQLNRYIGTPEGREYLRTSLQRMEYYRSDIESKITDSNVPLELMAIPIVESGYRNLPETNKVGWGAGLWMFIAPTARVFGLKVDSQIDERLNVDLLTDAAIRYLQSNFLRFKDWNLAILAYNIGESNLQKAIEKTGTKDAWSLIRLGHENDRDYLPRVMAAILIMRNPETIK